jgi:lysophospholipase L1-like esterase
MLRSAANLTGHFLFCAILFLLALTACKKGTPDISYLAPESVVLAFGNSITFGTGAEEGESYPARLEELIGRPVINAGVPGEVTSQGRVRLAEVLDQYHPALILICLGGNDMLRKMGDEQAADNIRAMVKTAKDSGVEVVLIGVPKPGLFPSAAHFYGKIADEFNIPFEGDALTDILSDGSLKSDPIHPNAEGYKKLAQAIAALLKKEGAI